MVLVVAKRWTETELRELLITYCAIPFGKMHSKNPDIIRLASRFGRTPGSVAMKMVNFASLDPTIDRKGMSNVSALDRKVWADFFQNIDHYVDENKSSDEGFSDRPQEHFHLPVSFESDDVSRIVGARRGQQWFRRAVLASYEQRCALSGISDNNLLVASHIAPWAMEKKRRLDPRNGICLNALCDRAFDAVSSRSPTIFELYSLRKFQARAQK